MKRASKYRIVLHFVYGTIIFIGCFSTLEQFSGLNEDMFGISKMAFHLLTFTFSLVVGIIGGYAINFLERMKSTLTRQQPTPEVPPDGRYDFRPLQPHEITSLHKLAGKMYGASYSFTEAVLHRWYEANPKCFFGLIYNNELVGYFDAFPISAKDYAYMLEGKDEKEILPQTPAQINPSSSFYIASLVVEPIHRGAVHKFVLEAISFYSRSYPQKTWNKVCAFAYTDNGMDWCKHKGMAQMENTRVWYVDRLVKEKMTRRNWYFWNQLMPASKSEIKEKFPDD